MARDKLEHVGDALAWQELEVAVSVLGAVDGPVTLEKAEVAHLVALLREAQRIAFIMGR